MKTVLNICSLLKYGNSYSHTEFNMGHLFNTLQLRACGTLVAGPLCEFGGFETLARSPWTFPLVEPGCGIVQMEPNMH